MEGVFFGKKKKKKSNVYDLPYFIIYMSINTLGKK